MGSTWDIDAVDFVHRGVRLPGRPTARHVQPSHAEALGALHQRAVHDDGFAWFLRGSLDRRHFGLLQVRSEKVRTEGNYQTF